MTAAPCDLACSMLSAVEILVELAVAGGLADIELAAGLSFELAAFPSAAAAQATSYA